MKTMKKIQIVIAPRSIRRVMMVPACHANGHQAGLMLTSPPKNPGFKAWVKGRKGIWEHGETRSEAENKLRQTLSKEKKEIEVIQQKEEVW